MKPLLLSIFAFVMSWVHGAPLINIISPRPNQLADEQLFVGAQIQSSSEISGEQAALNGQTTGLVFSSQGIPGQFSLLQGTALDVTGGQSLPQVSVMIDHKPDLVINSPTNNAFTTGILPVDMRCSDDLGPCSLSINVNGVIVATNEVTSLDLSAFDHSEVRIRFIATDSKGQQAAINRYVFIESNPRLTPIPRPSLIPSTNGLNALAGYLSVKDGVYFYLVRTNDTVLIDEVFGFRDTDMVSNFQPVWDGHQIVHLKRDAHTNFWVAAWNGSETWRSQRMTAVPSFVSTNKWTAYTVPGNAGQAEIWVKPPEGNPVKRTSFNASSTIQALNPAGQVILSNAGTNWISFADNTLVNLGHFIGQAAWVNDQWMVFLSHHTFRLDTSSAPNPLVTIAHTPDGQIVVQIQGDGSLEVSDDLVNWIAASATSIKEPANQGKKFYRLKR